MLLLAHLNCIDPQEQDYVLLFFFLIHQSLS